MTRARLIATATTTLVLATPLAGSGPASAQTISPLCATKGYRIYERQNIGCTKAKRVLRAFVVSTAPKGWRCSGIAMGKCRNPSRGKRFKFIDRSLEGR